MNYVNVATLSGVEEQQQQQQLQINGRIQRGKNDRQKKIKSIELCYERKRGRDNVENVVRSNICLQVCKTKLNFTQKSPTSTTLLCCPRDLRPTGPFTNGPGRGDARQDRRPTTTTPATWELGGRRSLSQKFIAPHGTIFIFVYLALPAVRFYLFLYRLASYNYMVECDQKVGIHVCSRIV